MTLSQDGVTLRALEAGDIDRTFKWHGDAELYERLGGTFRFVSRAAEEEWLRKQMAFSPNQVNLAICVGEEQQHIGNIYLRDIDYIARHGELHIFIGETVERGKGYGRIAVQKLIRYAFLELGLQRLFLFVLEENAAAIHLYSKCGFVTEGVLRQHVYKAGVYKNLVVMGLCRNDAQPLSP